MSPSHADIHLHKCSDQISPIIIVLIKWEERQLSLLPTGNASSHNPSMHVLEGAFLIFILRICDVSVGTLRVMFMVRSQRLIAAVMSVGEATVYLLAISRVLKGDLTAPLLVGYACGYAAGTVVGITLEQWLAIGSILVRVISAAHGPAIRDALLGDGFGVTAIDGTGKEGPVLILFVVARRRRSRALLGTIRRLDAQAFITIEPVAQAIGGHQPMFQVTAGVDK